MRLFGDLHGVAVVRLDLVAAYYDLLATPPAEKNRLVF